MQIEENIIRENLKSGDRLPSERFANLGKICDAIKTKTDEAVRTELDKRSHYEVALTSEKRISSAHRTIRRPLLFIY